MLGMLPDEDGELLQFARKSVLLPGDGDHFTVGRVRRPWAV